MQIGPWFDPISEKWNYPPAPPVVEPPTFTGQPYGFLSVYQAAELVLEEQRRKAAEQKRKDEIERIWNLLVVSARGANMGDSNEQLSESGLSEGV